MKPLKDITNPSSPENIPKNISDTVVYCFQQRYSKIFSAYPELKTIQNHYTLSRKLINLINANSNSNESRQTAESIILDKKVGANLRLEMLQAYAIKYDGLRKNIID